MGRPITPAVVVEAVRTQHSGRYGTLDRVRGLAIGLMVVDHALVAAGAGVGPIRLTLTRLALPLFLLLAGALWTRSALGRRHLEIGAAGLVATGLGLVVGIGQPDVLLLILGALVLMRWAGPVLAGAAAIQATTWPMGWTGYEPGVVVVLVVLGHLYGARPLDRLGQRLPAALEVVGRHPLGWYLGHLAVLALLKVVF